MFKIQSYYSSFSTFIYDVIITFVILGGLCVINWEGQLAYKTRDLGVLCVDHESVSLV